MADQRRAPKQVLPVGAVVEIRRRRPYAPGSSLCAYPGDRGVITEVSATGYAVNVGGVVVPVLHSDVIPVGGPDYGHAGR